MKQVKAIIFDIDDTLVRTIGVKWDALKKTAKDCYKIDVDDTHIRRFWGFPFEEMLSGVFSNIDTIINIKKHYIQVSKNFPMTEQKYARKAIAYLKQNYTISAVTASSKHVIFNDLKDARFDLDDFFYIQTAEDTKFHKPDPRVFDSLLTRLEGEKIRPNEIIYIGDSIRDYQAAKKAGLQFLAVTTGLHSKKEFEAVGLPGKKVFSDLLKLSRSL